MTKRADQLNRIEAALGVIAETLISVTERLAGHHAEQAPQLDTIGTEIKKTRAAVTALAKPLASLKPEAAKPAGEPAGEAVVKPARRGRPMPPVTPRTPPQADAGASTPK